MDIYCRNKSTATLCCNSIVLDHFFSILHVRFGQWCLHFGCSNVVSSKYLWNFSNVCVLKYLDFVVTNRRFPFDTKNPIGYALAMLDEGLMGLYAFIALISLATIAIDCFLYVTTMAKDMIRMLNDVKRNAMVKNDRPRILGQLYEFVEFHSSVKQLSNNSTICQMACHNSFHVKCKCGRK